MKSLARFTVPALLAAAAAPTLAHAGELHVGAQTLLVPHAEATLEITEPPTSFEEAPLDVSYGLAGTVDYELSEQLSLGAVARIVSPLGIDRDNVDGNTVGLDLSARLTARAPLHRRFEGLVHLSAGYSLLFLPEPDPGEVDAGTPRGLILGIAAGGAFALTPSLSLVGEVGYTFGFQETTLGLSGTDASIDAAFRIDLVHIGIGAAYTL
jgi:hypothetical protein